MSVSKVLIHGTAACIILGALAHLPAIAQFTTPTGGMCSPPNAGATCGGAGPASLGNTIGVDAGVGNPINIINGNKHQTEVDLPALPGELGIEIVRHYNSSSRHVIGQLGAGWRLSYETDLHAVGAGVQIVQADGARLVFDTDPDLAERPKRMLGATPAQGWVQIRRPDASPHSKEYIWHWTHGEHAGRRLHFNHQGRLTQIVSASGAVLAITRGPKGELLEVLDPQGRRLSFQHASRAQREAATPERALFGGVHHIDTPVGRFSYEHGRTPAQAANLVRVHLPTHVDAGQRAHEWSNRLASTSSLSRSYHFEDERHPRALTGISALGTGSDGQTLDQRLSTYAYDERGRAVFSARGAVGEASGKDSDKATKAAAEQVQLQFLQPALPTREGQTLLTNSLGEQTLYQHRIVGGEYRLTQAVGAGCAACGPVNLRWSYDSLGRLVEITQLTQRVVKDGQVQGTPQRLRSVRHTLDAQGRTQRIEHIAYVDGQAQAHEPVERHEHTDARWPDKPTLLARPSVVDGREHRIALTYNEAGQVVRLAETGWSPLHSEPLLRTTTYTYANINNRSLLVQTDGPLANGPLGTPQDSDITTWQWDERGNLPHTLIQPGGLSSRITHDPGTGLVTRVVNDAGFATTFTFDARLNLTQLGSTGPGWAAAQVQRFQHDALGHLVETFNGPPGDSRAKAQQRSGFDAATGRLLWRANSLGVLQYWRYDTEGRVEAASTHSNRMALQQRAQGLGPRRMFTASAMNPTARPRQWLDDFGRVVRTDSPDSGTTLRRFDEADRLIGMTDAQGHTAVYEHDVQGRIRQQTVTDAGGGPPSVTTWRYDKRHLLEVIHPTQREHFEHDARGLRAARIVTLVTPSGEHTSVTRYEHDETGQLTATTLPDGSRLTYPRNGQGQVVGLERQRVVTPWLRWLEAEQSIAHGFERDLIGPSRYTAGNGVQTQWQRSTEGALARLVVRRGHNKPTPLLSASTQETIERLLGVRSAHAGESTSGSSTQPGALGLPTDSQALIDHRYLWSSQGHLLLDQQRTGKPGELTQHSHAYDAQGQLVASVQASGPVAQMKEQAIWRYAYDPSQRRVLSQQGVAQQSDLASDTRAMRFQPNAHRLMEATYNANGQPRRIGQREYVWDALGRLIEVREQDRTLARYRHDHRGLRIAKEVMSARTESISVRAEPVEAPAPSNTATTLYLHDESRQPLAELDAHGRITRQYIFLADLPIAVIDTPADLATEDPGIEQIFRDLTTAIQSWFDDHQGITWLHTNHLGAPELATNAQGDVVWRASYSPFGEAKVSQLPLPLGERAGVRGIPEFTPGFTLHLRLPGQFFDPETGLHNNRQRIYEPALGQYLTPDPLGTPDGPNPYAYVAFNPLRYVDPDGLILFAFDGTGNTNEPSEMNGGSFTNVWKFRELYDDGARRYITGVGTIHKDQRHGHIVPDTYAKDTALDAISGEMPLYLVDQGGNYSGRARIERMIQYFNDAATNEQVDNKILDIDIIGFSRGAAQARVFANLVTSKTKNGWYEYTDALGKAACQRVNFRFMGLWDTVISTDWGGQWMKRDGYDMDIPDQFRHVAQAVALNEYRQGNPLNYPNRNPLPWDQHWGGFPLESIGASSNTPGKVRIERGFLGAHADIGGGYAEGENQLSFVALNWMVTQATLAGVAMQSASPLPTGSAALHDKSNAMQVGDPRLRPPIPSPTSTTTTYYRAEDREVRGAVRGNTQRTMGFNNNSMTNADTHQFIAYRPRTLDQRGQGTATDASTFDQKTGTVDLKGYVDWLREHGYAFDGRGAR
jgi:RHS repeat-associated protein